MALQGTIDTFGLPDVFRLLASTAKTGRLAVTGNLGTGSVWLRDGQVIAARIESENVTGRDVTDVVFALLRFSAGSFNFEPNAAPADDEAPRSVDELLAEAEALMAELREIEKVVPNDRAWLALAPELPGESVDVSREAWSTVVAVGTGAPVRAVAERTGLSGIEALRRARDLVVAGLAQIVDPPETAPAPGAERDVEVPVAGSDAPRPHRVRPGTLAKLVDDDEVVAPGPPAAAAPSATIPPAANPSAGSGSHDDGATEAPVPAAGAPSPAGEPPGEGAEPESVDRGLLLKFLGSVERD